jgi:hypothetical protein
MWAGENRTRATEPYGEREGSGLVDGGVFGCLVAATTAVYHRHGDSMEASGPTKAPI